MTKQELDILGYTYTNLTSGYVGINYQTLLGADKAFVTEMLEVLRPIVSEKNLTDIYIGLDVNGIRAEGSFTEARSISEAELPDIFRGKNFSKMILVNRGIDGSVYETDYVGFSYIYGNDMQAKSKAAAARAERLETEITEIAERGLLNEDALKRTASTFTRISSIDDISICLYCIYPGRDTATFTEYSRRGLIRKASYKSGILNSEQTYSDASMTETTYHDGLPVRIQTTLTGMHGASEISTQTPTYDNGVLVKSKTIISKRLTEGFQPICYVYRHYDGARNLVSAKINDQQYGKKSYTFQDNGFTEEEDGNVVSYAGVVQTTDTQNAMQSLKQLLQLEGAIRQVKSMLPEVKMDYKSIFNEIYEQKVNYAITAMKDGQAMLYIADKGNMTIYDLEGNKAVYFPVDIIKKFLPAYKNYPNVIVEQKIKEGSDPEAIRLLYEFGKGDGKREQIYAFLRVVKALSKNPATPADILRSITDGIHEGRYDSANLVLISANPNADTDTLQEILNHNPSVLVKSHISEHKNRPTVMKAKISKAQAKRTADAILGTN